MGKSVKNTVVKSAALADYLTKYSQFSDSKRITSLRIIREIADKIGSGYFVSDNVTLNDKGIDNKLKSALSSALSIYWDEQATACREEVLALPEHEWSANSPSRIATGVCLAFQASAGKIELKPDSAFKAVRSVVQFVANTQGREACYALLQSDNPAEFQSAYIDWINAKESDDSIQTENSTEPEGTSASDSEATIASEVKIDSKIIGLALNRLVGALHNKTFSEDSASEIAKAIGAATELALAASVSQGAESGRDESQELPVVNEPSESEAPKVVKKRIRKVQAKRNK